MKNYIVLIYLTFFSLQSYSQQQFNGIVFSGNDHRPLPGATVRNLENNSILVTGKDGKFQINFPGDKINLHVTFTGYVSKDTTLIKSSTTSSVVIVLNQLVTTLNEVTVSTGYQELPKERSTGSFDQIDHKTFNQQVSPNILNRLPAIANSIIADQTTGGANGRLIIRGLSTIQGPKDPLIVVDNFPYDGNINNINPNDVESITILKDAAASSIWGARAGNGVVVITTKKGRYNQPLDIELNSNVTIGEKPNLSYIPQMSSSDFTDVEQMLYGKGYYKSQISSTSKPALSPVVEILIKKTNGTVSAADAEAQINALRNIDVRDQFHQYLYQHPVNQQYALSMTGGSRVMAWTASNGYDKDISNLAASNDRLTLRFQNKYKPINNLQLSSGLLYTLSHTNSGKPGYGDIVPKTGYYLYPYAQFADANGNPLSLTKDYEDNYKASAGNGKLLNWQYQPLDDYKNVINTTSTSDIVANAGANYRIWKGLFVDVKYQFERQQSDNRNLNNPNSYFARNLVNQYTQISTSGVVTNNIPVGSIVDLGESTLQSSNWRAQLNFNQTWGEHELSVIAGNELKSIHIFGNQNRLYGYNDDLLTFGNVSYTVKYPNFVSGSSALVPDSRSLNDQQTNYVSYFSNAAYTYKSKYTLSVSARNDASNLFGLNTNDQWNPFWSTGLSWNLSNESFFHLQPLYYLRLRATYGYSGNINPALVAATTITYNAGPSPYSQSPYARYSNYYNPDLKWETSRMANLGMDFSSFNDRLSGSLEYYQKKGTDLFGRALLDYTSGVGASIVKNVASMKGQGIDVELKSLNVNRTLKWTTTLNFSYYHDQVLDYYLNSLQGSNFISSNTNVTVSGLAGKPVYSIFAYKSAGLDPQTGDPRGFVNGQISKDYDAITGSATQVTDLKYFGSAIPTKFGSLINTISYKNLALNFSVVYKLRYYFRRTSINYTSLFGNWLGNADFAKRWQNPGDEIKTNVPSLAYPASSSLDNFYAGSESLVEKGDHIRLQYINLSYDLSKASWHPLPFKSVQLYVNVNNVGILWRANKYGIDPDAYNSIYSVPNPRTYSLGLRTNF